MKPDQLGPIDAKLRALPVTAADKVARCACYDNEVPRLDLPRGRPHMLMFEKINGFKDEPSVNAAHAALTAMAEQFRDVRVVVEARSNPRATGASAGPSARSRRAIGSTRHGDQTRRKW